MRLAMLAFLLLFCGASAAALSCTQRCVNAGHCCMGNSSACQLPSCQMGCNFGAVSPTFDACNATCYKASKAGCTFTFAGSSYGMCGDCSNRWLDPTTLTPQILPGPEPFWPPGFALPNCNSCGSVEDECVLGCKLAFNPGLNPTPPNPQPPPPVPLPPAPWPNAGPGFNFSVLLSSHMVLQQAPQAAAVFGNIGSTSDAAVVVVTVTPSSGQPYSVTANVSAGRWKALLHPTAGTNPPVSYTIAAACTAVCSGSATLLDVLFGDVFFGGGQSNWWLQLQFTYARNSSFASIAAGDYDNIRVMSGDSQSQGLSPSLPPTHQWRRIRDAAALDASDPDSLDQTSAASFHFAEALTDQFRAAGKTPPTLGIVSTAIGGSMIEEWINNEQAEGCYGFDPNANGGALNHVLWDAIVRPYSDMTVKGWLFLQGENNAGSLHGNSANKAGYGCLMPTLIAAWRKVWSAVPGTTDPNAPFGLVTLSTDDSEGAADMASFRWAQQGSYGVVPNPAMPNVYLAHAFDLADPWVNCGDAPQTTQCPGCDTADASYSCLTPYYMGPGIHPRLKKPIGQRLAAAALVAVYGWAGPVTGPTLAGCTYAAGATPTLVLQFDTSLLAGAALVVAPYDTAFPNRSGVSVLVGSDGTPASGHWLPLNIALGGAARVSVDLTPLGGAPPQAVKYAWGATGGVPNDQDVVCCPPSGSGICEPGLCPLLAAVGTAPLGGLPANPFLALLVGGKCECPAPQVCGA